MDSVTTADNFIELGGHSLLTIRIIVRLAKDTGVELAPQDLFGRSLGDIAALLDANASDSPARRAGLLTRIQRWLSRDD